MAATWITQNELRTLLGIGSLYADSVVEEVCQAAENTVKSYLWYNNYNIVATQIPTATTATVYTDVVHEILVGETVVISNSGTRYNGSKTVTAVTENSITYTIASTTVEGKHPVNPYGLLQATTHIDYGTVPQIREATALIAVDIFQSRQTSNAGGISPDFQPSPYRMGNTLIARIRGLIAPHLAPNSLVG